MINSKELLKYTKDLSILFVEDHDDLRSTTHQILNNFFDKASSAENGHEALKLYNEYIEEHDGNSYDIILTDLEMPKMNGVQLTQNIYSLNPEQTILVLSAHDESKYLLPLINLGIEQFIKKPLDFQELLKVLLNTSKKLLNKPKEQLDVTQDTITINDIFTYDRKNKSLTNSSENIYLTKYEIIFMDKLTTGVGKIFSNEDIVNYYISLDENIDAQNIRKLVSKLRKKLPDDSLESIYGVGYRLIPFYD